MRGKVKVVYFAQARDAVGRKSESADIGGPVTAGELLDGLVRAHAGLGTIAPSLRLAVNQELVTADAVLKDGDEVAVLPPVAGG